jgi:hypothetical protein
VLNLGPLDQFSAFHFENYLGSLKRLVRAGHSTSAQLQRRLQEKECVEINVPEIEMKLKGEHKDGPVTDSSKTESQFKSVVFKGVKLSSKSKDSHIQSDSGDFFRVLNILQDSNMQVSLLCEKLCVSSPLYHYPQSSAITDFYLCKVSSNDFTMLPLSAVNRKCIYGDIGNQSVIVTLKHSN